MAFYNDPNKEIDLLCSNKSHLILVDIDNGIWLLKNSSLWLLGVINKINHLKKYCDEKFENLEIKDIKININEELQLDDGIRELSNFNKAELTKLLTK